MIKKLLLLFVVFTSFAGFSQDFSNKGKDFWVGYGYHQIMTAGNAQEMVLYFATDQVTNITISIPGNGYSQTLTSPAGNNVLTSVPIPKTGPQDARLNTEGLSSKGIHITSDKAMVAYAHVYNASVSGATILFPTNTLGKEYYSVNYKNTSNSNNANCFFYVVAADTGATTVEITPTANTTGGWIANNTYTVNLTQGQVYNVMGVLTNNANPFQGVDLTGSRVKSISSGTGGCKRVAVFSGSGRISISCNNGSSSSDNYMVQAFPKTAWGKKYLTVPAAGNQGYNIYRVCVLDPSTVVKVNGIPTALALQGGFYYEISQTNQPQLIEGDKPILVAQYFSSQGSCGNGTYPQWPGDPEMIYLSPVEQNIAKVLWNATPNNLILSHYFNVVIKNAGTAVSSFRVDGIAPSASFANHPQDPGYVYLQQSVTVGPHIIQSDSGFNAIAYGFGNAESYGYNAGTNIRDLYNFITPINPLNISLDPSACTGTPFYFSVTFPFQPTSLNWDFHNYFPTVYDAAPVYDTTYMIGSQQVWRYKLPNPYTYSPANFNPGYPVTITAGTTSPEGCGNTLERDFNLAVYDPTPATIGYIHSGCITDSVAFKDSSNYPSPVYSYKWYWDFGDGTFGNTKNPKHLYTAPGTYTVRFSMISNVGCISDTATKQIVVTAVPSAKFGISNPVCAGLPVTFTDSSVAFAPSILTKWYWDFGDGNTLVATTNANQVHSYPAWGPFTAKLKVETNSGCQSAYFNKPFTVNPIPFVNFTMPAGICLPADSAHFFDVSTIADGTQAGFNYLWNFGDPPSAPNNTSVLKNPAHFYTTTGPFSINLQVTSAAGCVHDTTRILSNVYAQAHADFTVNAANCLNTATSFTDNSNGSGNPINTYFWDFGDASGINNLQNPTHTYATAGIKTVKHWINTTVGCTSDTMTKTITINPLPTATITGTTTVCVNAPSPNITFTGAGSTAPYTFTYTINGGANQTVTTTAGNSVTVAVPTTVTGTFVYTLVSVQDGSSTTCSQLQSGSATVTVNPLPTATITGTTAVCLNAASPLITFTGAGGVAPYTFTYTLNGGANQNITTVAGNSVTITAPTNTAGTYTYSLVSVQGSGSTLCSQNQSGSAVITVNPLPTGTISGTTAVCVNAPSPNITFTGAGGTAPYTFTYKINGGANQTITTVSGNTVTLAAPTTVAGVFTYTLVSVQDGSTTLCSQSQAGSAVITVNPLPTATISGSTTVCLGALVNITFTGAAGTAPYTFTYTLNGGANQTITTVSGNSVTIAAPTGTAGIYTYTLISVQDGSSTACNQAQSGTAVVTVNPSPTGTITGTTAVCLNAASPVITFTGANGTAPYTFTYNINGGANLAVSTTIGNSVTINAPTTVAGTFTYTLVNVQDGSPTQCNQSVLGSAVITVNPLPTANFTYSLPSCETRTITFTDNSVANAGTLNTWTWNFGDPGSGASNTSTLQNPTHSFAASGTYTVTLTVGSNNSCNSPQVTKQVVINARPQAGYIVPQVCLSDTYAQFTDTSHIATGTITGWAWNFGDPGSGAANTSALQNPTHSYTAVGSYTVRLIVTSNNGCKDTISHSFIVNGSNPVSDFTVSNANSLCANDTVSITNASSVFPGVITKIEIYWDNVGAPATFITDNAPTPGKVYKHLYPNFQAPLTKNFMIRFRAYSGGVCVNDKLRIITVNAAPKVQFNAIPNACLDAAPFQITQATEIGGVPGSAVFSGPGVSSTGLFNPALVGPGTYTIHYTYTSTAGGCTDSASKQITVLAAPVADYTFSTPDCETKSVTFTDASNTPVGTLNAWTWNFGDGTPSVIVNSSAPLNHVFAASGSYTVTLKVTTNNGCNSVVKTQTVVVSPQPRPNFTMPASLCLPTANVQFTNTSSISDGTENSFTYLWDFGDPASGIANSSVAKNPSHPYITAGPFSVKLQVTSGAGCIQDTTIQLSAIHPQPVADFTMNKTGVCLKDNVTFTDRSNGLDGTVNQWHWDYGDGTTGPNSPVTTYTYLTANTYTVSLFVVNSQGCNSDTFHAQFTVYAYPVVDAGPDKAVLEGGSVVLQSVVTGNSLQYLWTPNLYLNDNTVAAPVASNLLTDMTYTLLVTAQGGCSASDQVFVKLLKAPRIPNTFTPNNDGINDVWVIEYLNTYPNNRVQVFTRTGQLVFESHGYSKPWDGTFNGKPLPFDTYYYIIEPNNGRKPMTGYVTILK